MDNRTPAALSAALLKWYDAHRRTLPWREEPTPYRVLLSELMLQQTRVDTVLPYFARFLERWPTLADLASAEEEEVVREWAGLGYYSRARNLLRAAQMAHVRGGIPGEVALLRELPGVGPYTAGAVASIAFGVSAPLVDGNVERVLCRLDRIHDDPREPAPRRRLWDRAEELVPSERPGDHNQALMELGAMVCTSRNPGCPRCPWLEACLARASDEVTELPNKPKRTKVKAIRAVAGLLCVDEGIWMGRRPPRGLLGGLWEPLSAPLVKGARATTVLLETFALAGLQVRVAERLGEVVHVFTHRRLTQQVYRLELVGSVGPGEASYERVALVPLAELDALGLSKLARKTLALGGLAPGQLGLPLAAAPAHTCDDDIGDETG